MFSVFVLGTAIAIASGSPPSFQVQYGDRGPSSFKYGEQEWVLDSTAGDASVEILSPPSRSRLSSASPTVTTLSTATAHFVGKHDDGAGAITFMYDHGLLNVTFEARKGWKFISKQISVIVPGSSATMQHVGAVTLSNATAISCTGTGWNNTYTGNNVVKVARCNVSSSCLGKKKEQKIPALHPPCRIKHSTQKRMRGSSEFVHVSMIISTREEETNAHCC